MFDLIMPLACDQFAPEKRAACSAVFLRGAFFILVAAAASINCLAPPVSAQQNESEPPAIVQPGPPGQPSRVLPPSTKATLPPLSPKDIEFMQHMIVHHAQAVEMTAMIEARTKNEEIRRLGARIRQSQTDEIKFMKRWLEARRAPVAPESGMSGHHHHRMMPGMLTPKQMEELKNSSGAEFDRLFLQGMIQHHNGALEMVEELFEAAGAGQDAELFNFATDVDNSQRAEIKIMQTILGEKP